MPDATTRFDSAGFVVREEFNNAGDHEKMTLEIKEELARLLGIKKADGTLRAGWEEYALEDGSVVVTESWKRDAATGNFAARGDNCPIDPPGGGG